MIKDIPNAIDMRTIQLKAIQDRDKECLESLINSINRALMDAATNGCN